MPGRICLIVFMLSILALSRLYAGELTADEAVNHYQAAVKFQKEGNWEGALIEYRKVVLLDPVDQKWRKFILNNTGIEYFKAGMYKEAEQYFLEALAIDPNYRTAQVNLGLAYEKTKSKLESLEYWLKFLEIKVDELKPKQSVLEENKTE